MEVDFFFAIQEGRTELLGHSYVAVSWFSLIPQKSKAGAGEYWARTEGTHSQRNPVRDVLSG